MGRRTRPRPSAGRRLPAVAAAATAALLLALTPSAASGTAPAPHTLPGGYRHLVVIYEENHSFDNLYGTWGPVGGRTAEGLARSTARQRTQRAQDGTPYRCPPRAAHTTRGAPAPASPPWSSPARWRARPSITPSTTPPPSSPPSNAATA
ncbi:hypothetical protein ACF09J_23840 [Streptomyces sp. NPDC014889]|uniref:hypothetical protein n=1 Tax=Streptomyces sp. NPDC014889 TaxID=3364928 RepID=UPI0036FF2407